MTFSDGNPVDAAAAKAALDRTIKLGAGAAYEWDAVKSIKAKDATTLVFTLKYAAPLDLIASSAYAAFIYDTKAASGDLAKGPPPATPRAAVPTSSARTRRGRRTS